MFRLFIAILFILAVGIVAASEPDFKDRLTEAIKEHPPGDYYERPVRRFPAVTVNHPITRTDFEWKLWDIVIPSLAFKDTPAWEAFQTFSAECIKNDPAGEGLPLVFTLDALTSLGGKNADDKLITVSCTSMPAEGVLEILTTVFNLRYEAQDTFVLISPKNAIE